MEVFERSVAPYESHTATLGGAASRSRGQTADPSGGRKASEKSIDTRLLQMF